MCFESPFADTHCRSTHSVMLVMELCKCSFGDYARSLVAYTDDNDLDSTMHKKASPLAESAIVYVLKETLKALEFLHDHDIWHRDVKGANILLTSDHRVKVIFAFVELSVSLTPASSQILMCQWQGPIPSCCILAVSAHRTGCHLRCVPLTSQRYDCRTL